MHTSEASEIFDLAAAGYDTDFSETFSGKAQRAIVHRYLVKSGLARPDAEVLELNAGTGTDALFLHTRGCRVTCSDVSRAMREQAEKKCKDAGADISVVDLDMRSLPAPEKKYHLIFSNFSGWNCLKPEELQELFSWLNHSLLPGGSVVAVLFGTNTLSEQLYFALKGNRQGLRRRKMTRGDFTLLGIQTPVYYYTPSTIKKMSERYFLFRYQQPVGIVIPPGFLSHRTRGFQRFLFTVEKGLQHFSFLANAADHYLIHLQKKG